MTPFDVAELVALDRAVFGSSAMSGFYFRQLLDLFPAGQLVATHEGSVVGYVLSGRGEPATTGWILSLGVDPEVRGRGLGARLLARALAALSEVGCQDVRLTVEPDSAAVRLYERYGFVAAREEADYFGDRAPRLVMCRPNRSG
ncbi:MAG: GNAT family N-acetyltransferase [Myxococcales bacterium]|nr:GNAT family N-acetyltransferase [Myxococcales bacterium]